MPGPSVSTRCACLAGRSGCCRGSPAAARGRHHRSRPVLQVARGEAQGIPSPTSSGWLPPGPCSSKDLWPRASALWLVRRNCLTRCYRGSMRRLNSARPGACGSSSRAAWERLTFRPIRRSKRSPRRSTGLRRLTLRPSSVSSWRAGLSRWPLDRPALMARRRRPYWNHSHRLGRTRGAGEITVSDVRRARRATGLSIAQVAERSHIPAPMIRQLEWGYVRNWPTGLYGRTQLVRYARAAGLDEEVVVGAIAPLLVGTARRRFVSLA